MGIFQWQFLGEPLGRWFAFLVAIILFLAAWNGVVKLMKAAG